METKKLQEQLRRANKIKNKKKKNFHLTRFSEVIDFCSTPR